ncbi:potassium transporter [Thalassobaculum fulvum]|uniref:Potassium transporter n=1 Tax=Thalassobaculum fulvum TaxID=1633335 RepID=A0A918XTK0_9PROT|nr:monovalent cation:proton antiporter-2 (CPA2) family protein [Thalassobaculum fulvum]GHD54505.1 potassium transporter [Thalassobaculum fulvum]
METLLSAFGGMPVDGHGGTIGDALVFLAAAVLVAPLLRRLKFSLVLGYLAAGAVIGPHALGMVDDVDATRELADIGVVFLLFAIGLELSLERLKVMRRLVFGLGAAQVAATAVLIAAAGVALGYGAATVAVVGASLALSSTAFVLQLMTERGELATRHGRAAFAVLLFQDLAVVPILVVVPLIAGGGDGESIALALSIALLKALAALAVIVIAGRQLLRPLYHIIAAANAPEVFTAMTLLVVLGIGWATQMVGLSMALGAFLAGLLLSESEFRHQVEADIEPFRGILLGLFFMTVGMTVDLGLALRESLTVLGFLAGLVGLKLAVVFGLVLAFRMPFATALRTGALLAQGGEFAFVILGLADSHALISDGLSDLLFLVVAISMATTPLVVALVGRLADLLEHRQNQAMGAADHSVAELEGHVIIAGFGRVGRTVARLLDAKLVPYVALDTDAQRVREGRRAGQPVFYGDASRHEVLRRLGGERAQAVVVTLTTSGQGVDRTVAYLKARFPELPVYARARDPLHARRLEELGAEGTVLETLEASLQLGGEVLRRTGAHWRDIEELIRQLRFVDGISDPIGVRPAGEGEPAAPPADPVLAAAMFAEEEERQEEAERAEAAEVEADVARTAEARTADARTADAGTADAATADGGAADTAPMPPPGGRAAATAAAADEARADPAVGQDLAARETAGSEEADPADDRGPRAPDRRLTAG